MKSARDSLGPSPGLWEHFAHQADIGIRGIGATKEEAFSQAAMALTAVVADPAALSPKESVQVSCSAPDDELLLVDWLNEIVYEMSTRKMLFGWFEVQIDNGKLSACLWGQKIDSTGLEAAIEVKGATYTELKVKRDSDGNWIAQCVVDV